MAWSAGHTVRLFHDNHAQLECRVPAGQTRPRFLRPTYIIELTRVHDKKRACEVMRALMGLTMICDVRQYPSWRCWGENSMLLFRSTIL
jgi:hypothetical protein